MAHLRGFGSLLKMTICHVSGWHRYAILSGEWKKRTAIYCRSSCKWLLKVRPFATVYLAFLAFQCCQMLSKKQLWQWPLTREKKPRLNELAKHCNQVCKTRHHEKFASLKLVQLAPRSFCHAADGIREQRQKSNFSGEEWHRLLSSSNAAASSMSAANTTCKCVCAMVLFSSSCASLPVSSSAIAAPYPQCPGRRLQAGPSGDVFQSNVDLRDSFGGFVPAKWTVMAMISSISS